MNAMFIIVTSEFAPLPVLQMDWLYCYTSKRKETHAINLQFNKLLIPKEVVALLKCFTKLYELCYILSMYCIISVLEISSYASVFRLDFLPWSKLLPLLIQSQALVQRVLPVVGWNSSWERLFWVLLQVRTSLTMVHNDVWPIAHRPSFSSHNPETKIIIYKYTGQQKFVLPTDLKIYNSFHYTEEGNVPKVRNT
jgi:hypothetical protein